MTILNFKRADGLDNLPGFYKIQYVPARLVVSIPASVNGFCSIGPAAAAVLLIAACLAAS